MSATPRPWEPFGIIVGEKYMIGGRPQYETLGHRAALMEIASAQGLDDADLILRAVNAHDALLTLAKVVAEEVQTRTAVVKAILALNALDPKWREWTP